MFHLRLCKGLSYMGIVRATKAEPDVYVPEEEKAKALVASGYFEMVTSEAEKIQPLTGDTEKAESATDMFEEESEVRMLLISPVARQRMISTRKLLRLLQEQQLQGQHSGKNRRRRKACY